MASLFYRLILTLLCFTLFEAQVYAEKLPPSRRVFSADLDGDGSDELLIAHNANLSAYRYLGEQVGWSLLWQIEGPGVVQKVLRHPTQTELIVAWGMGKGKMVAPITVSSLNGLNGEKRDLWSFNGGRSQVVALQFIQADEDQELELVVAHFVSKYHTRRVILDQLNSPQITVSESAQIRMATSWLFADIDENQGLEEVIGRVYGDEKGEYGDLSIQPFKHDGKQLKLGQIIPTERGVKHIFTWSGKEGTHLYFSDGWVANYGKKAKAGLKRVQWLKGRMLVEQLIDSKDEFTFFDLWPRIDEKTQTEIIFAQGNLGINVIIPQEKGIWKLERLLKTPPIVNAAIAYAGHKWWAFTPSEQETKVQPLQLPIHSQPSAEPQIK